MAENKAGSKDKKDQKKREKKDPGLFSTSLMVQNPMNLAWNQMQNAGKPRVSKQTTTIDVPDQEIDLSSMGTLLLMLLMGMNGDKTDKSLGNTALPKMNAIASLLNRRPQAAAFPQENVWSK